MKKSFNTVLIAAFGALLFLLLASISRTTRAAASVSAQAPRGPAARIVSADGLYTVTLQEGVQGGCQDTYLDKDNQGDNFESQHPLKVGGNMKYSALVKFDLSILPAEAAIQVASLEMYASGWSGASVPVAVHYISRTNVVGEVTWLQAARGLPWAKAGCEDTTSDRRSAYEDLRTITTVQTTFSWDLTAVVQGWTDGSLANNGVLLRCTSQDPQRTAYFASSEAAAQLRPRLVVTYTGPAPLYTATPTPTNTPTNTPTPTPTSTPTNTPTATSTTTPTPTKTGTHTRTPTPVLETTVVEIPLVSTCRGISVTRTALLQIPEGYSGSTPVPLVVGMHSWSGHAGEVIPSETRVGAYYAPLVEEAGWLLLAPTVYPCHVATVETQRYIKETVDYVCANYAVDMSRIYLVGISGGGYRAAVMAEKYPDFFAAAVEIKGPTDLKDWYFEDCSNQKVHAGPIYLEIGAPDRTQTGGFNYERSGALYMARNLKHVPIAVVHNTGHDTWFSECDIVPLHHAEELRDAINASAPDYPVEPPHSYYLYPGTHKTEPLDFPLVEYLSSHTLNTDHRQLSIHTDESKGYYWLFVHQDSPPNPERWTEVDAQYDPESSTITVLVADSYPVELRFNLTMMGMTPDSMYVVEQYDLGTGAYVLSYVEAADGWLPVSTSNGGQRQLTIYPQTEHRHIEILQEVQDTYLDKYNPAKNEQSSEAKLSLRKDDVYSPLLQFNLSDAGIPSGAQVLSAALRVYVSMLRNSPPPQPNSPVYAYRVNRSWVDSEASFSQARSGVSWAISGCNGVPEDRDGPACSSDVILGAGTWCSFDVTGPARDWVDDPETNHGVIIKSGTYTGSWWIELASSENETTKWHPQLVLVYEYFPPTPTPTATGTPTITSTPSPTPSATASSVWTATATPTLTATPTTTIHASYRVYLPVTLKPVIEGPASISWR